MEEIRFHGRGGQGAVVAIQILATALVRDGKHAACFPSFGFERRGAPVATFCRLDDNPIRERTQIYHPDCLVVLDPLLANSTQIYTGLKERAILVINTSKPVERQYHRNLSVFGAVNATEIGLQEIGSPITNYFPLWEAENGQLRLTHEICHPKQIGELTRLIGRFSHLEEDDHKQIQELVNHRLDMIRSLSNLNQEC